MSTMVVPKTRVAYKRPNLLKVFLAILAGSGIALAVAQVSLMLLEAG
jgi:hypothetical protein